MTAEPDHVTTLRERDVLLHERGPDRDLPVPARRRRLVRLLQPAHGHRALDRSGPRLPRPGQGPGRQRRRQPGRQDLVRGRHTDARLRVLRPGHHSSIKVRNDLIDCLWDGLGSVPTTSPSTSTATPSTARASRAGDPQRRLRQRHDQERQARRLRLRRDAQPRHHGQHHRGPRGRAAAGGRHRPRRRPAPDRPLAAFPDPAPPSFQSNVLDNTVRDNDIAASAVGIWMTNKAPAARSPATSCTRSPRRASSSSARTATGSTSTPSTAQTATPSRSRAPAATRSWRTTSTTTAAASCSVRPPPERSACPPTTTSSRRTPSWRPARPASRSGSRTATRSSRTSRSSPTATASTSTAPTTTHQGQRPARQQGRRVPDTSSGNRIEGNDASESEGTGISLEALSLSNILISNTSSNNDGDGIYIGDETSGGQWHVDRGEPHQQQQGLRHLRGQGRHLLKGNIANDNGGWGIWASDGSNGRVNTDGGGNKAQGNLGPLDPITLSPCSASAIRCDGSAGTPGDPIAPDTQLLETPDDPSHDARAGVPVHRLGQHRHRGVPVLAGRGGVRTLHERRCPTRGSSCSTVPVPRSARTRSPSARSTAPGTST